MIHGKTIRAWQDEVRLIENQWEAEAEQRGTTVSSSAWSYSGAGTLASEALTSSLASVKLTATDCGVLTNTVVLANGETLLNKREVVVST